MKRSGTVTALLVVGMATAFLVSGGLRVLGTGTARAAALTADEPAKRLVDLSACIEYLDKSGNLIRVKSEVDPVYELAGIAKKYEGGKCVLFEKVEGSEYPVLMGLLWNREVVGSVFGVPKEKVPFVIGAALGAWKKNKTAMESSILEKGPANEVIEKEVDLY